METLSDPRLPFTMQIPDGCHINRKQNPLNSREPCIVVQGKDFYTNIIWGPSGNIDPDTPPPGYELDSRENIGFGEKTTRMIVAHTSGSSPILLTFLIIKSLVLGVVIGTVGLFALWLCKADPDIGKWIALSGFVLGLVTGLPKDIKYAFVYKGIEYIFTGAYSQKDVLDQAIKNIIFIS